MPILEQEASIESNNEGIFEPHSPPHSPPEHQDEGVQDLQFVDELDQQELGQQVEDTELDDDEMLQFHQTAWQNLSANRSNYSSKPYESSYNYDNLKDAQELCQLTLGKLIHTQDTGKFTLLEPGISCTYGEKITLATRCISLTGLEGNSSEKRWFHSLKTEKPFV